MFIHEGRTYIEGANFPIEWGKVPWLRLVGPKDQDEKGKVKVTISKKELSYRDTLIKLRDWPVPHVISVAKKEYIQRVLDGLPEPKA